MPEDRPTAQLDWEDYDNGTIKVALFKGGYIVESYDQRRIETPYRDPDWVWVKIASYWVPEN